MGFPTSNSFSTLKSYLSKCKSDYFIPMLNFQLLITALVIKSKLFNIAKKILHNLALHSNIFSCYAPSNTQRSKCSELSCFNNVSNSHFQAFNICFPQWDNSLPTPLFSLTKFLSKSQFSILYSGKLSLTQLN